MATTDATEVTNNSAAPFRGSVFTVTPVVDNNNAYAALDAVHTNNLKFANIGPSGVIVKLVVIDKDDQGIAGVLHLFTAETTQTANSAFAPTDAQAATCVGSIAFGPYEDFNTSRVSTNASVRLAFAGTDLYGVIQTLGAPTYTTAAGLMLILQVEED